MTEPVYRIGVISDTHGVLRPDVLKFFEGVDLILHSGDVQDDDILIELEAVAPVRAVSGNVDYPADARRRPLEQRIETPIARIAMTHGHLSQAPSVNLALMRDHFSDFKPEVIIYGHSHIPKLEQVDGVMFFNPGSAGPGRFGKPPTVGMIEGRAGEPLTLLHKALTTKPPV